MQNMSEDEQEPRSGPKQATKFEHLPWSLTPELSLILERSHHSRKMNETPPKIPESRTNMPNDRFINDNETYAAWKAKKFPASSSKPLSNNFPQIHSSTQNSSNFLDSQTPKSLRNIGNTDDLNKSNNKYKDFDNEFMSNNYDSAQNGNSSAIRSSNRNERFNLDTIHNNRQLNSQVSEKYDSRQKIISNSSPSNETEKYIPKKMPVEHDYQLQHYKALPNTHCSEYSHHYHHNCCSNNHNHSHSTSSSVETETVRNLLQVITSQNEQIKNLQMQLKKLLRIHEQSLKNSQTCTCQSSNYIYQNTHLHDQTRASNLPILHDSVKNKEHCLSDLKIQDDNKNQQAILEQKVSIGVMTSFELKLQNNPSTAPDSNEGIQSMDQQKISHSSETTKKIKNLINNTGEMIRKPQNFFTPTILENISEGSESHMSSHRQSHSFMDSIRHSNEKHEDSGELQSSVFHRKTHEKNQRAQPNLPSNKYKNLATSNKQFETAENFNYKVQDPAYQRDNNGFKEKLQYRYNNDYEDSPRSSPEDLGEKQLEEYNSLSEPLANEIRKIKNNQKDNIADDCLSLSSDEIDLEDFSPESPEPSIHIDLQEYSSESGSLPPQRAAKVGWTICNNVLDQVNQILQNAPGNEKFDQDFPDDIRNDRIENNSNTINKVKATYGKLKNFGVSFSDLEHREPAYMKRVMFDATYYPMQVPEVHLATTSASFETNTSMYVNTLAMKYVKEEQVADLPKQALTRFNQTKQIPYNVQNTNMSFATMQYYQRYNLIPGTNPNVMREPMRRDYRDPAAVYNERVEMKAVERRELSPQRYVNSRGTSKTSFPNKILDITALKQQPKLL